MKKFLWVREDQLTLIDDPITVFKRLDYDSDIDKFYSVGAEIKVKVSIEHTTGTRDARWER